MKNAKKPTAAKPGDKNKKGKQEEEPEIDDSGPHIFKILAEEVKKNYIPPNKIEKAKLLDYTIGILHPDIITESIPCRVIIDKIQNNNFKIFNFLFKTLTKEEVKNLYFKHTTKDYFIDITEHMTCGPVAILVLINKEDTYLDENGIKTYYDSPVQRWKEMIGDKDPNVAKSDENALRGIYGKDLIHNGFWGSDNPSDAYRELSMFMLPLPSVPPKFVYDENLIKLKTIMNFLLPPKPDHPDISGRLDLIGKYGPIMDYHILDNCLCTECRTKIKDILKKKGVNMKKASDKILKEEFISENINSFCEKCKDHFDKWTHLITGFEGTHIATNEEISNMVYEMNENDLLEILKAEKGTSGKTILTKFDITKPPKEIIYTKNHILKLISILELDYYDRYNFIELQNVIMEDRRIRMNFWVSKMLNKPIEQFPNPKLINFNGEEKQLKEMKNPKSKDFTILRHNPIVVINKDRNAIQKTVLQHPILQKEKLTPHEIAVKVEKLSQRNIGLVSDPGQESIGADIKNNMILLRNYQLEMIKSKEAQNEIKKEKERLELLKYQ
jgi:nucleoside diphosphate kinase